MSMLVLSPRLQIVNGLPDSPKTEAKGALLVRGPWDETRVPPGCHLTLTDPSPSQVRSCADPSLCLYWCYDVLTVGYTCR